MTIGNAQDPLSGKSLDGILGWMEILLTLEQVSDRDTIRLAMGIIDDVRARVRELQNLPACDGGKDADVRLGMAGDLSAVADALRGISTKEEMLPRILAACADGLDMEAAYVARLEATALIGAPGEGARA